jgi:hypothetical protein
MLTTDLAIKRKSMWYAIFWTIVHLICLPFVLVFITLAIFMGVADSGISGIQLHIVKALSYFAQFAPLSNLVSIFAIWICYFKEEHKRMYFFCGLPLLVNIIVILSIEVIEFVMLY